MQGDADLIPKNIRKGIDIFGVVGTLIEGVSGIKYGTVTLSSKSTSITVTHGLGSKPSLFVLLPSSLSLTTSSMSDIIAAIGDGSYLWCVNSSSMNRTSSSKLALDTTTAKITAPGIISTADFGIFYNTTYKWIAIA